MVLWARFPKIQGGSHYSLMYFSSTWERDCPLYLYTVKITLGAMPDRSTIKREFTAQAHSGICLGPVLRMAVHCKRWETIPMGGSRPVSGSIRQGCEFNIFSAVFPLLPNGFLYYLVKSARIKAVNKRNPSLVSGGDIEQWQVRTSTYRVISSFLNTIQKKITLSLVI